MFESILIMWYNRYLMSTVKKLLINFKVVWLLSFDLELSYKKGNKRNILSESKSRSKEK